MRRRSTFDPGEQPAAVTLVEGRTLRCQGSWTMSAVAPAERILAVMDWPQGGSFRFEGSGIAAFDTGGAVVLSRAVMAARHRGCEVTVEGLRTEYLQLMSLVSANWSVMMAHVAARPDGTRWVTAVLRRSAARVLRGLEFVGRTSVALLHLLLSPSRMRWRSGLNSLRLDGVNALPITGLLTFLIGVVIAYQGAEQLRKFGTNIFIVDLVGISLLREIAPLIAAILIAGRSGSAYAAQIGTMKVTEELDALQTFGLSPIELLVLPRVLALVVALPLLTVYADVLGVFGGMLIASSQLNVGFTAFLARFEEAVALRHFLIGIGKAPFFAVIIALVGCYQGFQIRGGVDDVGRHTTISVVQSIFLVIIFDAMCSILLNWWSL
ncbi:MAG TPA: ABC transporter permease [Nitrospira sp.]|nr:ABC transporter permease [Nitrospira sp.]MBS0173616.1 ABC transporter permease [Nitrospira sp.]MCW5779458.1 ABC transporter permease [Nitrospira sp.]HNA25561.1 ABC transporter permease [Nitrospira sp.]HNI66666.1 ABC transporter permease [Nitrospira sp.]